MRVGGKPMGSGDGSPPEDESFSKYMCKMWSNMAKIFKNFGSSINSTFYLSCGLQLQKNVM